MATKARNARWTITTTPASAELAARGTTGQAQYASAAAHDKDALPSIRTVIEVPPSDFADLVGESMDRIPPALAALMDNVAVVVDDDTPPGDLFGRYEGVPLTERADYGGLALPDRITIFRQTICAACNSHEEVVQQVRTTVVHEIAHHFGIGDTRLDELGWG